MTQRFTRRSLAILIAALVAVGAFVPMVASHAQDGAVTVTFAVADNQRDTYNGVVSDFEKANPNIIVQLVTQTTPNTAAAATDAAAYLTGIQQLTSQADVVLVRDRDVSAEGTRAGYYLNLQPLIDSDTSINIPDFYPNVIRAFQWDQGMWALPISTDATVLTYDPAAFDKAGIAYPTAKWTLDDLTAAVKALTILDSSGKVVTPGIELFSGNNDIPLYMSLIGKPMFDVNAIPNPPMIDQPETATLLDGLVNLFAIVPSQSGSFNTAPIRIESIRNLAFIRANDAVRKGVLLPGGHAYLTVSGVAVSSSSQHPEQAYAFAKFLTTRSDLSGRGGSFAARQSLVTQAAAGGTGAPGGGPGGGFQARLTPELLSLFNDAIANGYSATDRRFYDFLASAIRKMSATATASGMDTKTAIASAQSDALAAEQLALTDKADASKVAVVATPVPTVDPKSGITLKFGMSVQAQTIPNKAEILALGDQFVAANPGVVGRVDVESLNGGGPGGNALTTGTTNFDCFYLPNSSVANATLNSILSLDPYLNADKTYDPKDFLGAALGQVTRDNKIWALPMNVAPTVMWYDPTVFANAGLPKPALGWGVDAFNSDVKTLAPTIANGNPPFTMQGDAGSSLLMLVASYGGLPIDWRTSPITVKFTDKTNVDAMQQVLDLAKNKLIDYRSLANTLGIGRELTGDPVYSQQLNGLNFGGFFGGGAPNAAPQNSNFTPVTFPKGPSLQLMSYSVGTLYISASAQNPDACYRWISLFAQHPELTNAMPARHSQLADAKMETTYGVPLTNVYRDVATVLEDPNTVSAPSLVGGFTNLSSIAVQHWLFQAWDDYVLNGKDLNAGLADAQKFADGFIQCTSTIPAYDPSQIKYSDYQTKFLNCATTVDPSLKAQFRLG